MASTNDTRNGDGDLGTIPLFVGGDDLVTDDAKEVRDPGKPDEVVGRIGQATTSQACGAIDAAQKAWPAWAALSPEERADRILAALDGLDRTAEMRARVNTRENGKVLAESTEEVQVFVDRCRLAASLAPRLRDVERYEPEDEADTRPRRPIPFRSEVSRLPLGVVTIIAPYNWPVAISAATLPYALVAGNCVVIKPPTSNPLALTLTVRHLAERLPPGVLNIVSGGHEAVAPIISDPRVRRVAFTGSVGGGQKMMEGGTGNLARMTLELGGNDPAVVLEDASLDEATVKRLVMASFMTAGQVCMGVKRVYVHRSRYDDLVEAMGAALSDWSVAHGLEEGAAMGPLITEDQRDFVQGLKDEASKAGHDVREYGTLSDTARAGGWFLKPALVLDPDPSLGIVDKEQFGPALPILPFDDADALVDTLNGQWAGLCSSVWSADDDRALSVARRLRTGTTWVNNHNAVAQDDRVPFGGFRMSGVGRELGIEGLMEFTEPHAITWSV